MYVVGINPTTEGTGTHDPSAAIFKNGELVFGAEEERFNRQKHATETFPESAVEAGLEFCDIELSDVDAVAIAWRPQEKVKHDFRLSLKQQPVQLAYESVQNLRDYRVARPRIKTHLSQIGTPMPPIKTYVHHRCHAASAFYPSGFDKALILTIDGRGERDATVVWTGKKGNLDRVKDYSFPNSLGGFFATVTGYLGYRPNNGEGKVMGLAPYGSWNDEIESRFREAIDTGVDYDVSALDFYNSDAVEKLESLFDRPQKSREEPFTDWHKDLAHVAQGLLEETVTDIVQEYCQQEDIGKVALAGGVALNCKMNKRIRELDAVDDIFIQPVAHDAGGAIGAGMLEVGTEAINDMSTVYWGPKCKNSDIEELLNMYKLNYREPDELEKEVARQLADGQLIGWMQGRLEMGPRALGNRSILADPRSVNSRDRVNKFVKHREEWRPFAPSLLEEAAGEYFINGEPAPYMIKTFDVKQSKKDEIAAVLHPNDDTARPQTVRENQNPRYYRLLQEFEDLTGVPVLLNTSFNDSGEPIVNSATEGIKDFFAMGLDSLVIENYLLEKQGAPTSID